jgi:dolichyl-phosphate beta-glucosyltransferase
MRYKDFQCGAKLFTRRAIARITPHLSVQQWAFDVELLYLAKKFRFSVKEVPTVWHDQDDSKLKIMRSGTRMLGSVIKLRARHFFS